MMVVGQALSIPLSAPPSADTLPPVPEGNVLLFSSHARGVQIYECRDGMWAFHAPRAVLSDPQTEQPTALHYGGIDRNLTPGPWWDAMRDSSRIRAGSPVSAPSPNPDSIPLLQLTVMERAGSGMFDQVNYIRRLNTMGGVGPTGACTTSARRSIDYTADYYFYGTR
jgi:hypothetical protein